MSESELTLAKVRQDSDYSYDKESYDLEEKAYNIVKMTDEEIKINFKFEDNSKSNTISIKEDGVNMTFDTDAGEMKATINEDSIELTAGGSNILINKDGDVEVTTQGKVKLNGDSNTGVLYEALRDFINSSYNSHTHGTPSGPSSPPTKPYTQSQSMKSQSVKLT
jgi:phosphotransferase system IIB component